MTTSFYAGGYWGSRHASVDDCADRLARFLTRLGAAHELLGTWFQKGRSRAAASKQPMELTSEAMRELLLAGRSRRDDDQSIVDELGYSAGLWNGADAGVGLSVRCGSMPRVPGLGNSVTLQLPAPEGAGLELYEPGVARSVMKALAECWEPDWATWTSFAMVDAQGTEPGPQHAVVGWMTYLSACRGSRAGQVPSGVETEALDRGLLVTIGSDPLGVPDPLVLAVRRSLRTALLAI